jgi:chromosome segregation ATPase
MKISYFVNVKIIFFKKDLIENDYGTYLYIKRNKELEYLLDNLNKKIIRYNFNIDGIKNIVSKYEKKCDFIRDNKSLYSFIKKKKLTSLLNSLKNCR